MNQNKFELCNRQDLSFRSTSFVPFWLASKCTGHMIGRITANWKIKSTGVKTEENVIVTTVDKIMVTDKKIQKTHMLL